MEIEKTIEELKLENEQLKTQLIEFNDRLKSINETLVFAKEYNVKLAFSTRLFAETHLTRDEKISIAQEFDKATSADQVERIYQRYKDQVSPPGVDIENDFVWSPGFIRELEKYYFTYKGYNPFEIVDMGIKTIRNQFKIEDDLRLATSQDRINTLKNAWSTNREASLMAVDEIIGMTSEILKK